MFCGFGLVRLMPLVMLWLFACLVVIWLVWLGELLLVLLIVLSTFGSVYLFVVGLQLLGVSLLLWVVV